MYDLGGTLTYSGEVPTWAVAKYLGLKFSQAVRVWDEHVEDFFTGQINEDKWWNFFMQESGRKADALLLDEIKRIHRRNFLGYPINLEVARRIKSLGKYGTVIVTDSPSEWLDYLIQKDKLYNCADVIISPRNTHMTKSNPEFFRYALNVLDAKPEETVFVNDFQKYVDIASNLGIHAFRLKNPNKFQMLMMRHVLKV
jgi:HAD superfamily hydrolase (TIGR01509 family)